MKSSSPEPQNILIILLGGIGDVIMFSPCLRFIRNAYPKSRISLLMSKGVMKDILEDGCYDDVILYDGVYNVIKKVRSWRYDILISTFQINPLKSAILGKLCRIPVTIGEDLGMKKNIKKTTVFLTQCYHRKGKEHCLTINNNILRLLNLDNKDAKYYFPVSDDNRKTIINFFSSNNINLDNFLIAIHPGSTETLKIKRWPEENFSKVIDSISEDENITIFIMGSKEEVNLANEIIPAGKDNVINTAGIFNLFETGALIERCNLIFGNDTGIIKIAEALDIPTISIWGPTDPAITGPYDRSKHIVIYKNLNCSPCFNYPEVGCNKPDCIETITVSEVLDVIQKRIKETCKREL
ncbi:MAG: glycosyltransferase family 9 protein [Candidatus Hydrogenedentota bacterium]